MERSLNYADILKKTLQEATRTQPRLQAIQLYPVCDADSGHFLILATLDRHHSVSRSLGRLPSHH
ncbi:MAG TPA: hypothetical protein V6D15_17900 [Oculatellaceae cyanobacterium]|jgi:hypothetical protein